MSNQAAANAFRANMRGEGTKSTRNWSWTSSAGASQSDTPDADHYYMYQSKFKDLARPDDFVTPDYSSKEYKPEWEQEGYTYSDNSAQQISTQFNDWGADLQAYDATDSAWADYVMAAKADADYYQSVWEAKDNKTTWDKWQDANATYQAVLAEANANHQAYYDSAQAYTKLGENWNTYYADQNPQIGWSKEVGTYDNAGAYQLTATPDELHAKADEASKAGEEEKARYFRMQAFSNMDFSDADAYERLHADLEAKATEAANARARQTGQASALTAAASVSASGALATPFSPGSKYDNVPTEEEGELWALEAAHDAWEQRRSDAYYSAFDTDEKATKRIEEIDARLGEVNAKLAEVDAAVKSQPDKATYQVLPDGTIQSLPGEDGIELPYDNDTIAALNEEKKNLTEERMQMAQRRDNMAGETLWAGLSDEAKDLYARYSGEMDQFQNHGHAELGDVAQQTLAKFKETTGWDDATFARNEKALTVALERSQAKDEEAMARTAATEHPGLALWAGAFADQILPIEANLDLFAQYVGTKTGNLEYIDTNTATNRVARLSQYVYDQARSDVAEGKSSYGLLGNITSKDLSERSEFAQKLAKSDTFDFLGDQTWDEWWFDNQLSMRDNAARNAIAFAAIGTAVMADAPELAGNLLKAAPLSEKLTTAKQIVTSMPQYKELAGKAVGLMMGNKVFNQEFNQMLDNWVSPDQALAVSAIRAGIEGLTEKVSPEILLDAEAAGLNFFWSTMVASTTEGLEEINGNILDPIARLAQDGELRTRTETEFRDLVAQGMDTKEALSASLYNTIAEDASSFTSGFLSALLPSLAGSATHDVFTESLRGPEVNKLVKTGRQIIETELTTRKTVNANTGYTEKTGIIAEYHNANGDIVITATNDGYHMVMSTADALTSRTKDYKASKTDGGKAAFTAATKDASEFAMKSLGGRAAYRQAYRGSEGLYLTKAQMRRISSFHHEMSAESTAIVNMSRAEGATSADFFTREEAINIANQLGVLANGVRAEDGVIEQLVKDMRLDKSAAMRAYVQSYITRVTGMDTQVTATNGVQALKTFVDYAVKKAEERKRRQEVVTARTRNDKTSRQWRSKSAVNAFNKTLEANAKKAGEVLEAGAEAAAKTTEELKAEAERGDLVRTADGRFLTKSQFMNDIKMKAMSIETGMSLEELYDSFHNSHVLLDESVSDELTLRQEAALEVLEELGGKLGIHFHMFDGVALGYDTASGKINGWYDKVTGDIYIDINAGNKETILFTAAHELTHFIRDNSEESYVKLRDYVKEHLLDENESWDGLVGAVRANYETLLSENAATLGGEDFVEEVVANAMCKVLIDGSVSNMLEDLNDKDQALRTEIVDYLSDFYDKVQATYEGLDPETRAGKACMEMRDAFSGLKEIFAEGLKAARITRDAEKAGLVTDGTTGQTGTEVINPETGEVVETEQAPASAPSDRREALSKQLGELSGKLQQTSQPRERKKLFHQMEEIRQRLKAAGTPVVDSYAEAASPTAYAEDVGTIVQELENSDVSLMPDGPVDSTVDILPEDTPDTTRAAVQIETQVRYSMNPATFTYAADYTCENPATAENLRRMTGWLDELYEIQTEIKTALGESKGAKNPANTKTNIHDLNNYLKAHPEVHQRLVDIQNAARAAGLNVDFVTEVGEPNRVEGVEFDGGLKGTPIEYKGGTEGNAKGVSDAYSGDTSKRFKFTAFWRSLPQMFLDSMSPYHRDLIRSELVKAVEYAYTRADTRAKAQAAGVNKKLIPGLVEAALELNGMTADLEHAPSSKLITAVRGGTAGRGASMSSIGSKNSWTAQAALRSAEKTLMALNLNGACPMFTIGSSGCWLDACYLNQMGNGATGVNLYRTAWYTGEVLQMSDAAIEAMNKVGGLRLNGVGDTIADNKSQIIDVLRHCAMRGLSVKIIPKQRATLECVQAAKDQGIDISNVVVQLSMDNLWIPAELDNVLGAGIRGEGIEIAKTLESGNLEAAGEMYEYAFGRATKIVDGKLYRKYGFSPEQVDQMMRDFPGITILPRYVVCNAEEMCEIALNRDGRFVNDGKVIQTLMHGKVPEGCICDYEGDVINFGGYRHMIDKGPDGRWRFYGVRVTEEDIRDENDKKIGTRTVLTPAVPKGISPYDKVMNYAEEHYTQEEQDIIWSRLLDQACCQANEKHDACAACQSMCADGMGVSDLRDFDFIDLQRGLQNALSDEERAEFDQKFNAHRQMIRDKYITQEATDEEIRGDDYSDSESADTESEKPKKPKKPKKPTARMSLQEIPGLEITPAQQKNYDANQKNTTVGSALKTLAGSAIKRYKGTVGKEVSGTIYFNRQYDLDVVTPEVVTQAEQVLRDYGLDPEDFKCAMWDPKGNKYRFDEAPDFDTAREPIPGRQVTVDLNTGTVTRDKVSYDIWHHKWLWVENDYTGFDVAESWNWSKTYLSTIRPVPPSIHNFQNNKASEADYRRELSKGNLVRVKIKGTAPSEITDQKSDHYAGNALGAPVSESPEQRSVDYNSSVVANTPTQAEAPVPTSNIAQGTGNSQGRKFSFSEPATDMNVGSKAEPTAAPAAPKANRQWKADLANTPEFQQFAAEYNAKYGEGAAESDYTTVDQLLKAAARQKAARDRAEQQAAKAKEGRRKAEEAAKAVKQERKDLTSLLGKANKRADKAEKTMVDVAMDYEAKLAAADRGLERANQKAERDLETAKADAARRLSRANWRHLYKYRGTLQNERVHAGQKLAEQKRKTEEVKAEAKEKMTLYKAVRSDKVKAATSELRDRRSPGYNYDPNNGEYSTLRSLETPEQEKGRARIKAVAQNLKDKAKQAALGLDRALVNKLQALDAFDRLQASVGMDGNGVSELVKIAQNYNSTVQTTWFDGLVDKEGNRIGDSFKEVFLCWDADGKIDREAQAVLQDIMLHRHNIDRMSAVTTAYSLLQDFEARNEWLTKVDKNEFAELVANIGEKKEIAARRRELEEALDKARDFREAEKLTKQFDADVEEIKTHYEANHRAQEYARLMRNYQNARKTTSHKTMFTDSNGKPITAETSRAVVESYRQSNPELFQKADAIDAWWDQFMREWAVGSSLSAEEYETMHAMYPHYAPTHRIGKGVGGAATSISTGLGTKKQANKLTGSDREIINLEDQYAEMIQTIIRANRLNSVYSSIVNSALANTDDAFTGVAEYDLAYDAKNGAKILGDPEDLVEQLSEDLYSDGNGYTVTMWDNGEQHRAYITKDLYDALFALADKHTGSQMESITNMLIQAGNKVTGPMKSMITGTNPLFGIRNLLRDLPTAQINSVAGIRFWKYWAQAWQEINRSENWDHFVALGGEQMGYFRNEGGHRENNDELLKYFEKEANPTALQKAKDKFTWFNETTESVTRFAEYLATLDLQGGDTYENRVKGIKNAAEVTVDFSRRGTVGTVLNSWIPYWNPSVQGVSKVVRSIVGDEHNWQAVAKNAGVTLTRALMVSAVPELLVMLMAKGKGRDDDYADLDDYVKDNYFVFPWGDEWIKIPKNREWAALLGTPISRMLQGLDGREDIWENYVEDCLAANFIPGTWNLKDTGIPEPLGLSNAIGVSQLLDLATNTNYAGGTIVGNEFKDYSSGTWASNEYIYNNDTSLLAMGLSRMLGDKLSPIQWDYLLNSYMGDFYGMINGLFDMGLVDGENTLPDNLTDAWRDVKSSWVADSRYSSAITSRYYGIMDDLGQAIEDAKVQDEETYKDTTEYQVRQGLTQMSKALTAANKEARGMQDGPEKDAVKGEAIEQTKLLLDYYDRCMSGEIGDPLNYARLYSHDETVRDGLLSLGADILNDENNKIMPNDTYAPSSLADPSRKGYTYYLETDEREVYKGFYISGYDQVVKPVVSSSSFKSADAERKIEMLEAARDQARDLARENFFNWLRKNNYRSEPTRK